MSGAAAERPGLPGRLRLLVAAEIIGALGLSWLLYAVFAVFGWPRPSDDVPADLAVILAPALIAIVAGIAAHLLWRRGRRVTAWAFIVVAGAPVLIAAGLWLASAA